MSQEITMEYLL